MGVSESDPVTQMGLPPGFRFFPTDEELLVQYLCRKVAGHHFNLQIIGEIDLYKFDPWVLPSKAIFGEKEWYFFSPRDRKYPNGSRPNRVAGTGYWKATGTDKIISTQGRKVGIKKALVFYVGKAPKGTKTNWIMHEYRLFDASKKIGSSKLDDWVLCRIYKKTAVSSQKQTTPSISGEERRNGSSSSSSSEFDDFLESFPEIDDQVLTLQDDQKLSLQNPAGGNFDWASFGGLDSLPELAPPYNKTEPLVQGGMNYGYNEINIPSSISELRFSEYLPLNFSGKLVDDGVQSGFRTQRVDNSAMFQHNSLLNSSLNSMDTFLLNSSLNSMDAFGFLYPTNDREFGFKQ